MAPKISERAHPVRYQAALICAALRFGADHDASDTDLDQAATEAGLPPAKLAQTREAVRTVLECPVDFMDDCNQTVTQALFDAADEGCPLIVVTASGKRIVMIPQPVEEPK